MESEGSLPHSQVPANCPYPEPDRSSPYPKIPLPEDPSQYYPPIYATHNLRTILLGGNYFRPNDRVTISS
jgi:hypothetical protein